MARREIHVEDPSALRAIAHPLRLKIIGLLRLEGPLTVGALGERVGAASGSVSYHLATLERHGFVEQAPELARDGRERWWRASADYTTVDAMELQGDPAKREAGLALRRTIVQSYAVETLAYLDMESSLEPEWIEASTQSDDMLWLTADELRQLSADLDEVVRSWRERGGRDREGARAVRAIYSTFLRP
ncbi:helix-turn-helix domain-containing protein [Microbacterium sp. AZCO]|uniref:ArsR/SmtB family transcription factor n=1 Tax=Microbacterium sp. AZCO TaxID=3142976 RepID=UPI0031F4126C